MFIASSPFSATSTSQPSLPSNLMAICCTNLLSSTNKIFGWCVGIDFAMGTGESKTVKVYYVYFWGVGGKVGSVTRVALG
jgi:hypothetical protein